MTPTFDTPAPLDPAQHGLWVTEQTLDTESAYHLSLALHVQGPLDPAALATAWGNYVRATPVLASRTDPAGPGLLPGEAPPLRPVTATPVDLGKLREEDTAARFAPGEALARATLFTTAPDRHLLLVVAHHLVFDGESKDLLVTGVARAYRAVTGECGQLPAAEAPAPAPPVSEADVQDATRFWAGRRHDTQAPALPGLTAHHADPVAPAPGSACGFRRDGEWHARLVTAAATLGVTRFELLTAAWHALLLRYGNTAPATAIELSTRVPGALRQVGLHVNELPLFTAPRPELAFADFAQEVRAELRALYAHRTVPLSRAVRGLTPRTALCPVSLSYRRRDTSRPADFGPGLDVRAEWTGFARTARNLAHLQLVDAPDSLEGSLQYRTAAFETEAPARVVDHFLTLLDGALAAPDTALGLLPVLPPRERATLLADTTRAPGNAPATLPALFAAQAAATPEAVAVIEGDTTLTYAELDAVVRRRAHRLRAQGAGPGALVGIGLPRSAAQLVAALGTLTAGAAYLPLDPDHPAERLAFLRADSGISVETATDPGPEDLDRLPDAPPAPAPPALADPAYVLYTSGSTGVPKGVEVSHGALANLLAALRDTTGTGPGSRWLGLTSLSFDISTVELFLPLVTGGTVVLVPEGRHRDGTALAELVDRHRLTHVQATPSGWRTMLAAGLHAPDLVALTGGEALPDALAHELRTAVGRLVNVYGPTETTVWSTAAELGSDDPVTIGRPLANTRTYVLDALLQPLPQGLTGELYIGGDGVAHGYRGRPGLTACRFVPDPFGPPGARLYRTGDLVRRTADGRLAFAGRSDTQVKVRGHRIELGEIDTALGSHPQVAQAVTVLRETSDSEPGRLVAYVVPAPDQVPPTSQALRDHLARSLPAAALPDAYVALDAMPLTPNGKLDRAALPEPPRERAPGENPVVDAGDEGVTATVLAIWREVLDLDDLGPDEDLFDLGGHSLTITAIAGRIRKEYGVAVPFDVFFDSPTVHGIAACVAALIEENQ
ncbi:MULTISPECIES: non-ribosomal peptide synthetase [unclassified Streptomyces]|uniref:non-ribosomal peptide synthetase n=1 Tax=unclassified Streptomyces TaxID=2593676 RepID=UPI000376CD6D|nr:MULTISPECIES: amino acid adenylation domain-containing protein [unclassified Streptomyces]MYQ78862.1 amino acid adenylation domain-containing protein [Streptomyces sp. SID4923]